MGTISVLQSGTPTEASEGTDGAGGRHTFEHVALGGTFDRLHAGHELLLSTGARACTHTLHVGIADGPLLSRKKHADLIEPFETRKAKVIQYVHSVNPSIQVNAMRLLDPAGTTLEDGALSALVVSEETLKGGQTINVARIARGLQPLRLILIDTVQDNRNSSDEGKLSSTDLRHQDWLRMGHSCTAGCQQQPKD
mmetsp:Transcript_31685/g.53496  ORF Transcript_31685/g.53496 Transcript_31685/m.53496 type:complete len:195 (-) Transcript_31685:122-706(-)